MGGIQIIFRDFLSMAAIRQSSGSGQAVIVLHPDSSCLVRLNTSGSFQFCADFFLSLPELYKKIQAVLRLRGSLTTCK